MYSLEAEKRLAQNAQNAGAVLVVIFNEGQPGRKEMVDGTLGEFDIDIIEAHHKHKVDAPSGTALMLGEAAADGRGIRLAELADRGRDGITGARDKGSIGFASIRGGDIVGKHDVLFASNGEQLTLSHNATDRNIFARGAIKAVLWGIDKQPGQYDMMDVLGLN